MNMRPELSAVSVPTAAASASVSVFASRGVSLPVHASSGTSDARVSAPIQADARCRGLTAIDAEYTGSAVRSRRRWIHRVG